MKVLFIIPSYKPAYIYGGPVISVSNLAESLVRAGHEVVVMTTTANGEEELNVVPGKIYSIEGVTVYYFRRWSRGNSNFSPTLLKAIWTDVGRFDIIHIQSWWNFVVIPAVLICMLKGIVPLLSPRGTLTGYSIRHKRNSIKWLFHKIAGKRLLNYADLVFTSEIERQEALKFADGRHTYVIPNLLNLPKVEYEAHKKSKELRVIFLGRIDPAKNIEFLIKVLSSISEFPYRCLIAGLGQQDYTTHLKQLSSTQQRIHWIGPIEGDDKFRKLAEADLLVLPSHTENYGNVVFEALSQGTAALVSSNVGSKEYIVKHNLGWAVDLDEVMWKSTLISIWQNSALLEDIRTRAPYCIARDFDSNQQVRVYIEMYNDSMKDWSKR